MNDLPECSHSTDSFSAQFFSEFLRSCYEVHAGNTDFARLAMEFPDWGSPKARAKQRVIDAALRMGRAVGVVYARKRAIEEGSQVLQCIVDDLPELDRLYARLDDDRSRDLMVELFLYRVLGRYRVMLTRNDEHYWQAYKSVERDLLREPGTMSASRNVMSRYEVPTETGCISLHGHSVNVLNTFLLRQYEYRGYGRHLRAEPGDVVIDAGGCWGDTALYFADAVGSSGRVYVLEFVENNIDVLQRNLEMNPSLASRVCLIPKAAWHRSDEILPYSSDGAATSLKPGPDGESRSARSAASSHTSTISIDDLVARERIDEIDLIKMDIEGAELNALAGAEETIRSYRPKLAISLYHRTHDFTQIPRFIDDLNLSYRMYIDHFTIHGEETMLFAWPS